MLEQLSDFEAVAYVLPANTARSRRFLWRRRCVLERWVNATAASRSTRAARQTIRTTPGGWSTGGPRWPHLSKKRRLTLDACVAGTLLLKRLATARRTPSTLAEYARAASTGDATDMPARLVRCSNSVLTADVV